MKLAQRGATQPLSLNGKQVQAVCARLAGLADEKTSPEIASHAARVLKMDDAQVLTLAMQNPELLRRIAASALTQAEHVTRATVFDQDELRGKVDAARDQNLAGQRPDERVSPEAGEQPHPEEPS